MRHGPATGPPTAIEEITVADLYAAHGAGTVTALEVTQRHLDRIAAYDRTGPALAPSSSPIRSRRPTRRGRIGTCAIPAGSPDLSTASASW
jgi:hypothetical protein